MLAKRHRSAAGLFFGNVAQHGGAILLAAGLMCYNASRGEEVGGGDPPEESPVWSVGSEPHGSGEHKTPSRLLYWAISEVRGGEDFPSSMGIRGYNSRSGAKAKRHELSGGGLAPSHGGQGAVSQTAGETEEGTKQRKAFWSLYGNRTSLVPAVFPCDTAGGEGPSEKGNGYKSKGETEEEVGLEKIREAEKGREGKDPPGGVFANELH